MADGLHRLKDHIQAVSIDLWHMETKELKLDSIDAAGWPLSQQQAADRSSLARDLETARSTLATQIDSLFELPAPVLGKVLLPSLACGEQPSWAA